MKTAFQVAFPLTITLLLSSFLASAENKGISPVILGRYDETTLTEDEMHKDIPMDLYDAENSLYDMKKEWVEKKAKNAFFDEAAKAAGLSRSAWEKREINDKVASPSQTELQEFLKHNVSPSQASQPETVMQVKAYLSRQKHDAREKEIYQGLLTKHHLSILVAKPIAPHIDVHYASDDPVKGAAQAPVTILEFTDFQCPVCKASQDTLKQIEQKYAGQVKLVSRQFPLPFHSRAKPAAEAALCAHEQGKFWEYRDKLFEKQELSDSDFQRYAKDLGLDQAKFGKCLGEHRYAGRVAKDVADGQSIGIKGTPTFFINGRPQVGISDHPVEDFSQAIADELAPTKQQH